MIIPKSTLSTLCTYFTTTQNEHIALAIGFLIQLGIWLQQLISSSVKFVVYFCYGGRTWLSLRSNLFLFLGCIKSCIYNALTLSFYTIRKIRGVPMYSCWYIFLFTTTFVPGGATGVLLYLNDPLRISFAGLIPYLWGWSMDTDPYFGRYRQFCGTIRNVCTDRNPKKWVRRTSAVWTRSPK